VETRYVCAHGAGHAAGGGGWRAPSHPLLRLLPAILVTSLWRLYYLTVGRHQSRLHLHPWTRIRRAAAMFSSGGPIDVTAGSFGRHGVVQDSRTAQQPDSSGFGTAGLLPSSGANRAKVLVWVRFIRSGLTLHLCADLTAATGAPKKEARTAAGRRSLYLFVLTMLHALAVKLILRSTCRDDARRRWAWGST
jgi:hypothetical protein